MGIAHCMTFMLANNVLAVASDEELEESGTGMHTEHYETLVSIQPAILLLCMSLPCSSSWKHTKYNNQA